MAAFGRYSGRWLTCREIRLYGAENFQVSRRMRAMIENLMAILPAKRHPALQLELDLLHRALVKLHDFPEDLALAGQPDLQGLGGASPLSARELIEPAKRRTDGASL